jgi:diguanylate cyclase (GGDEF)-like protein
MPSRPSGPSRAEAISRGLARQLPKSVLQMLPRGRYLPDDVWAQRHAGLVGFLWLQAPFLLLFGIYQHYSPARAFEACLPIVVTAAIAMIPQLARRARSASVAVGLLLSCSILVALSGGSIEAHFSYFVVIAFLTLYQEWLPFLIAIVFVLFEHGLVGIIDPHAVYNHVGMTGMDQQPWKWAFIHAGFVLAASFANLLAWRLTEHEALHDGLTGLPNRVLFIQSLELAAMAQSRQSTAVLFIDLDNFKDANDGFGHESGDQLLRAITARLRAAGRRGDLVGRLGGDEFGVIVHDVNTHDEGLSAAERYLDVFTEPFALEGLALISSASIGMVFADEGPTTALALMSNADLAMYDAKRAGGAQISIYRPDMHDAVLHRANFEAEIRSALAREEFVIHYQPLIGVSSGDIVGNEALVRWNHPTRGLLAPAEFIPAAEQSGLITALGRWVLRVACEQTVLWHEEHPDQRPLTVSVNLSPRQLGDRRLVETVACTLAETGLAAQFLCLEITEGAVIKDLDGALPKLRALKAIGVSLALDDFGTGYSSLSYLRQLPVDSLKIDRSFITDLSTAGEHRIVLAIIDLAHALGMSVTAEGVETDEQLQMLRGMSTNLAQGYLLGRPMGQEQMTILLDEQDATTHHDAHPTPA